MDYDDNNFQSQNFQLGGEDNNKFPPGLQYALPKFDFDEHIQIDLRFDGLAEARVLLGIESREDNHWIEDFSQGSSGIEFSPGAAESHSISMRNNVWSEATSSESVEMLLKSVGENDMIAEQTLREESEGSDVQDGLKNQMDRNSSHDDSFPSKMADIIYTGPTVLPDKAMKNPLVSSEVIAADLSLAESLPQAQQDEKSAYENLVDLDGSSIHGDPYANISSTEVYNLDTHASMVKSTQVDHTSAACGVTANSDNTVIEGMEADPQLTSGATTVGEYENQNLPKQATNECSEVVSCEEPEDLLLIDAKEEEFQILSRHTPAGGQHSETKPGESCTNDVSPSRLMLDADSSLMVTLTCNKNMLSDGAGPLKANAQLGIEVHSKDNEMSDRCIGKTQDLSNLLMGENKFYKVELDEIRNSDVGNFTSSAVKVSAPVDMVNETKQAAQLVSVNHNLGVSAAEVSSQDVNFVTAGKKTADKVTEGNANNTGVSSYISGSAIPEKVHCTHDLIDVKNADLYRSPSLLMKSTCLPGALSGGSQIISGDSIVERESRRLSADSHGVDVEIDASAHGQSPSIVTEKVDAPPSDQEVGHEPVTSEDDAGEFTELTCSNQLEKLNTVNNEDAKLKEVEKLSSVVCNFTNLDNRETRTEISTCSSSLEDSSSPSRQSPHSASLQVISNRFEELRSDAVVQPPPVLEKFVDTACNNESQASIAIPAVAASGADFGGHPSSHPSVQDKSGKSEAQCHEARDLPAAGDMSDCLKESLPQSVVLNEKIVFQNMESGSGNANTAEPNCGSPTVISCSEQLHSERETQEGGGKNSTPKTDAVCGDRTDNSAHIDRQVDCIKATVHDPKEKDVSEDDRSFTFEVVSLPEPSEREAGKGWKPFNKQPFKLPQSVEGSPTTSVLHQTDPEHAPKSPPGSFQVSDSQKIRGPKSHGKDKTKSTSGSTTERGSSKQRKAAKEMSCLKQTIVKDNKSGGASAILIGSVSGGTSVEGMRQFTHSEGSSAKVSAVQTMQAPGLPDLNSSASSLTVCHQPFTDLQQVQLRAQIFVYGSLIQGTAPDEACMASAFGDNGRGMWENVWLTAVERVKNQRSPLSNLDTPIHPRSGIRVPEQVPRSTPHHMKANSSPAGRISSKGSPLAVASPMVSLPPTAWSVSPSRDGLQSGTMPRGPFLDSHQSLTPLHPYQSPHPQHHVGNSTSWFSQASSPATWFVSQASALEPAAKYSAMPVAEAVQVTSVRDLTTQHASNKQLAPNSQAAADIPVSVPGVASVEAKKATSTDQKSRKRKKNSLSEVLGGRIESTQSQQASSTDVVKQLTTSVGISSPLTLCKVVGASTVSNSSPLLSSMQNQVLSGSDLDQQVVTSEEMCKKIEQAKLQAEDAAAMASSAIRHSQQIWSQLSLRKSSGLVSEVDAKLASAAVAAAAAATVAKAAAAAAKVASEAALQAKLMTDEATNLPNVGESTQGTEAGFPDSGAKLGVITPALILKGKDKASSSSSVILAAREAARKRVEAAAAATKRAENLDAVVKAAELAAEAVSQAGVIVAMGDPIPLSLSELIEAGPEGYWKVQQASSQKIVDANGGHGGEQSNIDLVNVQPSHTREVQGPFNEGSIPFLKEHSSQLIENVPVVKEPSKDSSGNEKGQGARKGRKTSELSKTIAVPPEGEAATGVGSMPAQIDANQKHEQVVASMENIFKEGSHVEVTSDVVGLRGFWFSAKVLSIKDGHAHVSYRELMQDEVRAQLKECIALNGDSDKAPKIRIAHPMTAAKFEGTRKRRRDVAGNYVWSVGDRVDALMRDGWCEGVVMEKGKEDETKLTIHFPAEGDSSVVRAWNLRPSLIWKDGQWIEWSRENTGLHNEHDTPQGKRSKVTELGVEIYSQVDATGKDNFSKSLNKDSRQAEDSRPLMLSAKDTVFSVGKSTGDLNNSDAMKVKQTGLQKEGSKVVFGVPKPGKKRKFMEVSKHIVLDQASKTNDGMDPIKVAKYLIPQGYRGWKHASRVDFKGKQFTDSKPKVVRPGKAQSIQNKTKPEKNRSSVSVSSAISEDTGPDLLMSAKVSSISHEVHNTFSNGLKAAENPVINSSLEPASDVPSSRKKPSPANEVERGLKGKLLPAAENMLRNEDKGPSLTDHPGIEPRRSNRRIQPTSRLLEGLQSSLIISKIPSVSHDKGLKTPNRSTPSSKGNNRVRE